jgi:hypothetical protein
MFHGVRDIKPAERRRFNLKFWPKTLNGGE